LKLTTFAWMLQDDYSNITPSLAEFREVAERLGNRFFIAWYRTTLDWAWVHQGDFARAEHALEIALAEDLELGGCATAGIVVALLGEIEALTGRYDDAEARLVPFLSRAAATGDYLGAPWGVPTLARVLVGRGRPEEAREMIGPFIELLRPLGLPYHISDGLRCSAPPISAPGTTPPRRPLSTKPGRSPAPSATLGWAGTPTTTSANSLAAAATAQRPKTSTTPP
jgi:tetratricopeptide (TPR) repeat protein